MLTKCRPAWYPPDSQCFDCPPGMGGGAPGDYPGRRKGNSPDGNNASPIRQTDAPPGRETPRHYDNFIPPRRALIRMQSGTPRGGRLMQGPKNAGRVRAGKARGGGI